MNTKNTIEAIANRLRTQDNRITQHPMFCVQIKVRDVGFDASYADNRCWRNSIERKTIYDDDHDFKEPTGEGWYEFGYVDRWETAMVAFTEGGCHDYLDQDGHNVRRRAFRGEVRIYVESFRRCDEMIAVRDFLMKPCQWFPMETAKNDGNLVLLKCPMPTVGSWSSDRGCWRDTDGHPVIPCGWRPIPGE